MHVEISTLAIRILLSKGVLAVLFDIPGLTTPDPLMDHWVGIVSLAFAAWGINLGRKSLKEARQFTKESRKRTEENLRLAGMTRSAVDDLKDSHKSLEGLTGEIKESMSTQYLKKFPDYLEKVPALIANSQERLTIIATVPTHGSTSAIDLWKMVRGAIQNKHIWDETRTDRARGKDEIRATIIYSDRDHRLENYAAHFKGCKESPAKWRDYKLKHKEAILSLLRKHGHLDTVHMTQDEKDEYIYELPLEDFFSLRLLEDGHSLANVYSDFSKWRFGEIPPIFCWISESEAIFSIKVEDLDGNYHGHGFYTRDYGLLSSLEDLCTKLKEKSTRQVVVDPETE